MGRRDGLVVVAEGPVGKLDTRELANTPGVDIDYDPHRHIRLGEIPLAAILSRAVREAFFVRGEELAMVYPRWGDFKAGLARLMLSLTRRPRPDCGTPSQTFENRGFLR